MNKSTKFVAWAAIVYAVFLMMGPIWNTVSGMSFDPAIGLLMVILGVLLILLS